MSTLRIKSVGHPGSALKVEFSDGRSIELHLNLFAKLRDASAEHRGQWCLIGKGLGVHWEFVDEDISLGNLLLAHSRINGGTYARGTYPTAQSVHDANCRDVPEKNAYSQAAESLQHVMVGDGEACLLVYRENRGLRAVLAVME